MSRTLIFVLILLALAIACLAIQKDPMQLWADTAVDGPSDASRLGGLLQ